MSSLQTVVLPEDLNYRTMIDSVTQIIFRTDARGRFTFLNAAWQTITGFTVQESLGQSFLKFVHADDREAHAEIFQPLIENESTSGGHLARYVTKAGGIRWLEVVAELGFTREGAVLGMFGTLTDVTERRHASEQLTAARARLEHLLVSSPTVIYASAAEGDFRIRFVSENVDRLLGWTSTEVMDDPDLWRTALHPEDADAVLARLAAGVTGPGDGRVSQQYQLRGRDGEYRWINDDRQLVRAPDGTPLEMVGSWIDVTEHRRAEDERARLSAVVEQAAEAILVFEPTGRIVYMNAATVELTGYSREELLGVTPEILRSNRHDEAFYQNMRATAISGRVWSGRVIHKRKDKTLFEAETVLSPLRDTSGRITHYVADMIDVTQARETENQLRQSQKMEIAGRLAAGVAHDFNNLLTVITGRAQLLLQRLGDSAADRRDLELIQDAGRRAAALTRQLLVFSRKDQAERRRLRLNVVVTELSKMLQRLIGEDIELVLQLADDLGDVHADTNHLGQVIMNLAVNARDAMPLGGRLAIATRNIDLDEDYVRHHVGVRPGAHVELTVSDTGCGMDAETITHIFEPFFTTKGVDKGTGLGLSTVYGIVEQSGGHITVESVPGAGTTFHVVLPRQAGPTAAATIAAPETRARSGSETVLLVEDEGDVRGIAREALSAHGYKVLEARDGREALEVAAGHRGVIDMLITDVVMPRLGGAELAEQLRHIHPRLRVVFMSGYPNGEKVATAEATFLGKPFTLSGLARHVRAAFDGK